MKIFSYITSLLIVLALSSCDSKSTDPIDICVDAKIELYVQNFVTHYCSSLKMQEEGVKQWAEGIIQKNQNENLEQRALIDKFSKHLIKQHEQKVKLCSDPTVSNFKKLDIRDNTNLGAIFVNDGEFSPMKFRKECLEKFSK
jgi:hypothetical protein